MSGSFVGGLIGIVLSSVALAVVLARPRGVGPDDLAGLRIGAALLIALNAGLAALAVWIDVGLGGTSSLLVGLVGGIAIGGCSLTTGVIRRAERNSEIVAEREVVVIMIPGELYARAWFRPLRPEELVARLRPRVASA